MGAHDGHLDFHTAPDLFQSLCPCIYIYLYVHALPYPQCSPTAAFCFHLTPNSLRPAIWSGPHSFHLTKVSLTDSFILVSFFLSKYSVRGKNIHTQKKTGEKQTVFVRSPFGQQHIVTTNLRCMQCVSSIHQLKDVPVDWKVKFIWVTRGCEQPQQQSIVRVIWRWNKYETV